MIDIISADGESCTLTFEGYNTTEIVRLGDLRPCGWEEEEEGKTGIKKKKMDARANAKYADVESHVEPADYDISSLREKKAEMREQKKKKAQKKKERLQVIIG